MYDLFPPSWGSVNRRLGMAVSGKCRLLLGDRMPRAGVRSYKQLANSGH